jgi:hypothetical protein
MVVYRMVGKFIERQTIDVLALLQMGALALA